MGIINVTPDSFSDGGRLAGVTAAVDHGRRLVDEGADWLDVGGESTRPGALPVAVEEESRRVLPVIEGLAAALAGVPLSVDTRRAVVARRAAEAGATVVNDVSAGRDPEMAGVVRDLGLRWILMHMRGTPEQMQADTRYSDIVAEVAAFLAARVQAAVEAGVDRRCLLVDPGLGFGKALEDNPRLIAATATFAEVAPVVIGASRKAFIGRLTGVGEPSERVYGSIGASLAAAAAGAAVVRVHDVAATVQALAVFQACRR